MMDIILFEAIASRNIAWVAKKEIGDIPWFGHILKAPKNDYGGKGKQKEFNTAS